MNRLSYLAYQYIDGECSLHIPNHIVALEFTSCSFRRPSSFTCSSILPNIKFLQICNCRFSNYSFQRLLNMCPNVVHISITTSSWDEVIALPSNMLSIIWKHNEGEFTLSFHSILSAYGSRIQPEIQCIHNVLCDISYSEYLDARSYGKLH